MSILAAQDVTIAQLRDAFGLRHSQDPSFFPEWSQPSVSLSDLEEQVLDRIKANFTSLMDAPSVLENTVKMVVLAPILDLLGFYQPPFSLRTEPSVAISTEDEGMIIRGRIDILVLKNRLWLTVIESKRSDFSVTRALPQTLAYLLANPEPTQPSFGLITNGNKFLFLKATRQPAQYTNSRLFSLLNPNNELRQVLNILKDLRHIIEPTA
ncbi:MAG: restriction endonuclease subunit R [Synechococcales cyanobacterium CRU_2_2]|nr:restriction endonuclease subunit R [Synechococcales cyanobacterium CRU_2_2]